MLKIKTAILAGVALAAMGAASPASARDRNENCFIQHTGDGIVKICTERDGGYEFALRTHGDRRNYDWFDDLHRHEKHHWNGHDKDHWKHDKKHGRKDFKHPHHFGPPGHARHFHHHRHDDHVHNSHRHSHFDRDRKSRWWHF